MKLPERRQKVVKQNIQKNEIYFTLKFSHSSITEKKFKIYEEHNQNLRKINIMKY